MPRKSKKQQQAQFRPVFWISGNQYEKGKAWDKICSLLGDPNVETLNCIVEPKSSKTSGSRSVSAGDIILRLKTDDLFDTRPRILRVKGLPEDYLEIADYLDLVDNSNVLVFDGPVGYYASGVSSRFIPAGASKLYKRIKNEGQVLQFDTVAKSYADARDWIGAVAKELKVKIESDATVALVDVSGLNLDTLYTELLKLSDYKPTGTIKAEDVRECCLSVLVKETWGLIDDLDLGQHESACRRLDVFLECAGSETGTSFYGDVAMLLGALQHHFLFLLIASESCPNGPDLAALKQASASFVKKQSDGKEKPMFDERFMRMALSKDSVRSAMSWGPARLRSVYNQILDSMYSCRMLASEPDSVRSILRALLLFVCGHLGLKTAKSIQTPLRPSV